MNNPFQQFETLLAEREPAAVFDFLLERYRAEENFPLVFETHLMKKRHELGLPLIPTEPLNGLDVETQRAYDEGSIAAARVAAYSLEANASHGPSARSGSVMNSNRSAKARRDDQR